MSVAPISSNEPAVMSEDEEITVDARAHYESYFKECICDVSCAFAGSWDLSLSFSQMNEKDRVNTVRCILLAITALLKRQRCNLWFSQPYQNQLFIDMLSMSALPTRSLYTSLMLYSVRQAEAQQKEPLALYISSMTKREEVYDSYIREWVDLVDGEVAKFQTSQAEYRNYLQLQRMCKAEESGSTVHLVFDFAEKVQLPRLTRQPGQIHFTTGLRFDLFGVSSSNFCVNFIFGLPEGHWPESKTANEVLSMVLHVLNLHKIHATTKDACNLQLHADNCSGQNKNRYVLWFLSWLSSSGFYNEINLQFLVAGHTKNICDGAFGHIKRRFMRSNVMNPKQMMQIVEESAVNSTCIPAYTVEWYDWKRILGPHFTIPKNFKLSTFHVFQFISSKPGYVLVKDLSTTVAFEPFKLFKRSSTTDAVISAVSKSMASPEFKSTWPSLKDVSSEREGNRHDYLVKNIVNRYFRHVEGFTEKYLGSGE
eukprot:IDg23069t1